MDNPVLKLNSSQIHYKEVKKGCKTSDTLQQSCHLL